MTRYRRAELPPALVTCRDAVPALIMTEEPKRERDRQFRLGALRWLPEVARFALSLTRDESDADDLVHETFRKAYEAWGTYTPGTECRGWLLTICRHTFYRRRHREERQVTCDDPELEALAAATVHASARLGGYADLFTRFDLSDAIERRRGTRRVWPRAWLFAACPRALRAPRRTPVPRGRSDTL